MRIDGATRDLEDLQLDTERAMRSSERAMKKASERGIMANHMSDGDDDEGDEDDFEDGDHAVGTIRGHHVYTGESLLEMVLADHSFKFNHDNKILSGAHTRGEHKVFSHGIDLLLQYSFYFALFLLSMRTFNYR